MGIEKNALEKICRSMETSTFEGLDPCGTEATQPLMKKRPKTYF